MGIFFKDTIFLKDSCDLENEIYELENLKEIVVDKDELVKYIKFLRAGLNGERAIEYELKNARIGMYVLHDINIKHEDLNAQIDYVIITPVHCYLVECKNMVGDITVDNRGQFVRKMPWGKAESIYSPITQAQRHVDILKKKRDSMRSTFTKALSLFSDDSYYQPLVVVANSNGILNTKWAKKEVKDKIVRVDGLIEYLNKEIKSVGLTDLDSRTTMEKTAQFILSINTPKEKNNWTDRFELITDDNKAESTENGLRDKLINYRKAESKKRGYPAYYIFTNDQMDKIIEQSPKTIDELSKILEPIKVKMYGQDILNLIQ
ncbi:MAG: NERD domain-containing protein [Erysipelotrichaceae bacterium]|nr:NERD domain-containing protein [Erysipelotrichaceae bacterium]